MVLFDAFMLAMQATLTKLCRGQGGISASTTPSDSSSHRPSSQKQQFANDDNQVSKFTSIPIENGEHNSNIVVVTK